jgi:hypothetical protein
MKTVHSSLKNRYAESARTKDTGGGSSPFSFPADVKFYKPKEGRNRIIILPYKIKTKKHPLVAKGRWTVGDLDYVMDVWVHQRFGGGELDLICLKKNYNKPCPACEIAEEYRQAGKEDEYKASRPSRRVVYNVLDARAPEKGVMIFSTSHYLFEKELIEEAIAAGENGEPVDFADWEDGKIISFRGSIAKIGQNEFLEFKSFTFEPREQPLPRGIEEEIISLDEVMTVYSYDDMKKMIYGQNGIDEEAEEVQDRGRTIASDDDEEEVTVKNDRRPVHIENETKSFRKSIDTEEENEKEDRIVSTRESDVKSRSRFEGSDRASSQQTSKRDVCPSGHRFGVDWDTTPDCEKCKVWDKCGDTFEELKKTRK